MGPDALTWSREVFTHDLVCSNGNRVTRWHDERNNFYDVKTSKQEKTFRKLEEAIKWAETH